MSEEANRLLFFLHLQKPKANLMVTEKEIVYSILNSLRGSHSSNNDMISERLIRSWINTERANLLLQFTDSGRSISQENYQNISIEFSKKQRDGYYKTKIPKILFFNRRSGIRIYYRGESVLMCTKTQNKNYEISPYLKEVQRCWVVGDYLYSKVDKGSMLQKGILDIDAVLFNPSDDSNYNWETDTYPLQGELVNVLKTTVLKNNGNIINPSLNDTTNDFSQNNSEDEAS